MYFYYEKLNKEDIEKITDQAGKTAHLIRNLCQGFVGGDVPEITTLDSVSGTIEAQCRQIKGQVLVNNDIKSYTITCARSAMFLKKILHKDFFSINSFPGDKLEICRTYVANLCTFFERIDNDINKSIISFSDEIFKPENINSTPTGEKEEEVKVDLEYLRKEYNFENFDKKWLNLEKNYVQFKNTLNQLGGFLSNNAHFTQDLVADLIHSPPYNEQANQIIKISGDIENNGRSIISISNQYKPNLSNIGKQCDSALNNVKELVTILSKKDFLLVERAEMLNRQVKTVDEIANSLKTVIQKSYK